MIRTVVASLSLLASVSTVDAAAHPTVSVSECHDWGFDPHSLSCDTCAVLTAHPSLDRFRDECLRCCQAWRADPIVNPEAKHETFVGRYQGAVLVYDPRSLDKYEEVKNFMTEGDRDDVVTSKGKGRFKVVEKEEEEGIDVQRMNLMNLMGGRGGGMFPIQPPTLYFFKDLAGGIKTSEADEKVALRGGWKREDIKDMLMTVLP